MSVSTLAEQQQAYMVAIRRDLHARPELSEQEAQTGARVMAELTALGIPFVRVGDYGVVATIEGTGTDRAVALRADMDALPVQEENTHLPYMSKHDGVMHACGHDGHTAMLLGAARVLKERRDEIRGVVKLCFQQAEETGRGVPEILAELKKYPVECCFGIHLWSGFETGKISVEAGPRMAAGQRVTIVVTGQGTHGAYPHKGIDPILAASSIVMNLAALMSREVDPIYPSVLTFGAISGGTAGNVVPEHVTLSGSLRTTNKDQQASLIKAITRVAQDTAQSWGATARVDIPPGVSVVINDPHCSQIARGAALKIVGAGDVAPFHTLMASENFGDFLDVYPGVFAFIGVHNKACGATWPHHHPKFNIDEDQLWKGAALHAQFAIDYLQSPPQRA